MIVVTGGAGLIGSAAVWELNNRGIENIIIVDSLKTSEKWKNLRALKYHDYMEKEVFIKKIKEDHISHEISAIIHMGACSSTWEKDGSYLIDNNFEYTKVLAEYCIDNSIRFIYASSAATYGDGDKGFKDNEDEMEELRPLNMYGYSKQMFDLYAKRKDYLSKIVGLKFFNVFGPNEYHKGNMTSKIYKSFFEVKKTGHIELFKSNHPDWEDGCSVRDFIYVKDVAKAIVEILNRPDINGIFNVGTSKSRSWKDLALSVFKSMGEEEDIKYIEMFEHLKGKYQYYTESDNTKIKKAGIDIKYTELEDAIEDYVKNYLIPDKYLGDE